jgi:uncharacterized membrane protein YqjE
VSEFFVLTNRSKAMKTFLTSLALLGSLACGWAATTINVSNEYAYSATL